MIIKRKPKGVTAKAFIDEIMRNVQIQDGNWNKKVKSEIFCFFFCLFVFLFRTCTTHGISTSYLPPIFKYSHNR